MKIFFLCIINSLIIALPCLAQSKDTINQKATYKLGDKISLVPIFNTGNPDCKTCECNLENLLSAWKKENIENYNELIPISYKRIDKLTDRAKIEEYYKKISNLDSYYLYYSGNSKLIKLIRRRLAIGFEKPLLYMDDQLAKSLSLNSTIYSIRLKLKNGAFYENYAVCDVMKKQISYDNMFFYLWL